MTRKKTLFTFAGIYLFLYVFNYLHPLSFGDDYLYSFVWQGKSMFTPLTEDAVRVSSLRDLFTSQWSLYLTWGGRTIGQMLTQFFLWMGKGTFDIFNALVGTLLVAEIYWCIHKGDVSYHFDSRELCWIFFLLWAFTPAFSSVFLWLTAACIYLWTHTILLAFLIPYVRKYYHLQGKPGSALLFKVAMFFGGIIAGWTNENSVCWILLLLIAFNYISWKDGKYESWMGAGFLGLLIGYALLMLAPGNVVRLQNTYGINWFDLNKLKANLHMFVVVSTYQLFLWYFTLRSLYQLKNRDSDFAKDYLYIKTLCVTAFGTIVIMLLSPFFPARSGFFGTILLIIATGVLLRLQDEYKIVLIKKEAKKFLLYAGLLFFVMTVMVSLDSFYKIHIQMQNLTIYAQRFGKENNEDVLVVTPIKRTSALQDLMSGFHVPDYEISEDENEWSNVAFARYYNIKGFRINKLVGP